MFVTYDELVDIFKEEISNIKNLKEFCRNNGFEKSYGLIVLINNGNAPRKYSKLIIKFLGVLHYAIEKKNVYSIERTTHHGDNVIKRNPKRTDKT
jgi:hypothetical protein